MKTLKAIEQSNVVIFVINSRERIGEQDLRLLAHVIDSGRSLIVAYNQWDGLESSQRQFIKTEIDRRLGYVDFAEQFFISALHGTGVGLLLGAVRKAFRAATQELGSSQLTALLETALDECQPPMSRGRRIKLRFAHPCGDNPPTIKIHGNQTGKLPDSYKRYLSNFYRKRLKMVGTPIQVLFADSDNPFKDRRNKLTPRQELQKRRMMKHVKKKKKK